MGATGKEVKPIPMEKVKKSSAVDKVGYCCDTERLAVQFKNGNVYHYEGVSKANHECLMKAESIGKHVTKHVIRGGYKCCKQ